MDFWSRPQAQNFDVFYSKCMISLIFVYDFHCGINRKMSRCKKNPPPAGGFAGTDCSLGGNFEVFLMAWSLMVLGLMVDRIAMRELWFMTYIYYVCS